MTILENTFAESCYNTNTIAELELSLTKEADESDMAAWGITEQEWSEQIKLAIEEKKSDKD